MKNLHSKLLLGFLFVLLSMLFSFPIYAESQGTDYKGVSDPFGDPGNYEFSEDEQEDKEFFHLGRYLILGGDVGLAAFTGGLGQSILPSFYVGGRMIYFFDRLFGLELGVHYSFHREQIRYSGGGADLDTSVISFNGAIRYYFDVKGAPRAIAVANPYLVLGGGMYIRNEIVLEQVGVSLQDSRTNAFGAVGGGGVEFAIYQRHIYLGFDGRYHLVFFNDENDTLGVLQAGERAGDYFTAAVTLSYNF